MSATANGNTVFSPVIFFIAFREALEASLVIGILLASVESLVKPAQDDTETSRRTSVSGSTADAGENIPESPKANTAGEISKEELQNPSKEDVDAPPLALTQELASSPLTSTQERAQLIRKLRKCILLGALSGLLVAFSIGAAFLAVFYTQVNDLWSKTEELWEGIFNLIAVCLIVPMSLAILRLNSAKEKWSRKLSKSFDKSMKATRGEGELPSVAGGKKGKWARFNAMRSKPAWVLFFLPFVTTLREGLEGVIFIGGVSLGLPATSIPLPAVVGLAVGFGIGVLIWRGGPKVGQVRYFLLFATCALFIIAAGMASRAVYYLQFNAYIHLVGSAAAESGSGPGSYDAKGAVIAHFDCCNPQIKSGGNGWGVLSSLTGWNNTWTFGTVFMYIGFWLFISAYLNYAMWKEGRLALAFSWRGREHRLWESRRRRERREKRETKLQQTAEA